MHGCESGEDDDQNAGSHEEGDQGGNIRMDKEKVFDTAFGQIDLKYVEEPLKRQEAGGKNIIKSALSRHKGWIAATMAILLCFIAGGVILAETDAFQLNKDLVPSGEFITESSASYGAYLSVRALVTEKSAVPADGQFHYTVDGLYASDFAPYYGGAYLNVHGQLVVCIAESAGKKALQEGKERLGSACTLFKNVKYSYGELMECMEDLINYCQSEEYKAKGFEIREFEIKEYENCIGVGVDSLDEDVLNEIRKQIRIPESLVFFEQEPLEAL